MTAVKIDDRLTVDGQPSQETLSALASGGFATIINNRPDAEEPGQPGSAAEKAILEQSCLAYRFIPVTAATITEADIHAFQAAVSAAKGPVYAHCRSGTRSLTLYVLGEVLAGRMKPGEVEAFGRERGFDLSGAAQWLARNAARAPQVKGFYEPRTGSIQYVVADPKTKRCAIIDPVYEFDEKSGATATHQADEILAYVAREGLTVEWILDTHPHADHFSAAHYLKQKTGAPTGIGARVTEVQKLWQGLYNWPELATDGSQWDRLFAEGDSFKVGELTGRVMFSPGHTLASVTYVIGDAAFVHDTVFMPDSGTARADFPGGSARALWASIQAILALPDDTRLFTGHDYEPGGRAAKWESTVGEQKREPASGRHDGGALRRAAGGTRPLPAAAEADPACASGQHPWRPAAEARSRRPALSQVPARCASGGGVVKTSAMAGTMSPAEMEARAGEVAGLLKTLSHPARLRLACALAEGEYAVGELEERLGIRQPTLSQQLGALREAGVVTTRREAKQIFYRLSEEKAARLIEALYAIYCEPEQQP